MDTFVDKSRTGKLSSTRIGRIRTTVWRRTVICVGLATVTLGVLATPSAAQEVKPTTAPAAGPAAVVTIPARRIPTDFRFVPPHVAGDREFNGNGPDVFARAFLNGVVSHRRNLTVTLCMDAVETKPDRTRANGCSPEHLIYQAPLGQCIRSASRGVYDELRYRDTDHALDVFGGQVVGSFVSRWEAMGDTDGSEAGTRTGVSIFTSTFTVTTGAC